MDAVDVMDAAHPSCNQNKNHHGGTEALEKIRFQILRSLAAIWLLAVQ